MKFLGRSYTRTGIDLQDKGAVSAAIYRYLEHGNADELKQVMSEPWAQTKDGQKVIHDMMEAAQNDLAEKNHSNGHSYEITDYSMFEIDK